MSKLKRIVLNLNADLLWWTILLIVFSILGGIAYVILDAVLTIATTIIWGSKS